TRADPAAGRDRRVRCERRSAGAPVHRGFRQPNHPHALQEPFDSHATVVAGRARGNQFHTPPRMRSEAFSAIIMVGALVFPPTIRGMTDASTTRNPRIP